MYYATFKDNGERITTYVPGVNCDAPPEGAILISDEDQALYATNDYIRDMTTGQPIPKPSPTQAEIDAQNNEAIKAQIAELEEKQHRAVREIIISNPNVLTNGNPDAVQRLQDTETQIAALRAQLK